MKINPKYIENGVVEVVDNWAVLTKLGQSYGMELLINLTIVKTNTPAPLEVYQSVEDCDIPKHILIEKPGSFRFTEKGIKWICNYIENNPFNDYLFQEACKLNKEIEEYKQRKC